jgi:hypothetical protein
MHVCVVVRVELLLLVLMYCRRGNMHVWVVVGAEMLLLLLLSCVAMEIGMCV